MRNLLLLSAVAVAVAACSTVPAEDSEMSAGDECRADGLDQYVGQAATAENGAVILRESGAKTLRWIAHGAAVTMDYRTDRVNVKLDPQNRIEAVTCG